MKELDIFMVVNESGSMTSRREWVLGSLRRLFSSATKLQVGEDGVCRGPGNDFATHSIQTSLWSKNNTFFFSCFKILNNPS